MLALFVVFVIFGTKSLRSGYLVNVHRLLHATGKPRRRSRQRFGRLMCLLTGRPSGQAAFAFMVAMVKSDWQFRRSALPVLV